MCQLKAKYEQYKYQWFNWIPCSLLWRRKYIAKSNFSHSSENQLNVQQMIKQAISLMYNKCENRIHLYIKLNIRQCTLLIQSASITKTTVTEEHITMEIHCWMITLIKYTHNHTHINLLPQLSKPLFRHESVLHEFAWLLILP